MLEVLLHNYVSCAAQTAMRVLKVFHCCTDCNEYVNSVSCAAQTALTVLEVALELWLALTASPQARMTRNGTSLASAMLAVSPADAAKV